VVGIAAVRNSANYEAVIRGIAAIGYLEVMPAVAATGAGASYGRSVSTSEVG
jgi:hypothetical protein